MAVKQSSMRYEIPSRARLDLRPDRHGRPRDERPARPARGQPQAAHARSAAPRSPRRLVDAARPRGRRRGQPHDADDSDREYVVLARGLDADDVRPDPRAVGGRRARALRAASWSREQVRALPAARRRAADDARRAPARLRQPRGHGPVRRRAVLPGRPRGHRPRSSPPSSDASGNAVPDILDGARGGLPGPGPHAHDRRLAPGRRGAGAPGGLDRRPREARLGGRHGPLHAARSSPTRATRRTTPTTTRRSPPRTRAGSWTRSCPPSTSPARCSRC